MNKKLDVTWDKVVIIDCLLEKERNDWQITEDLMQFLASIGMNQESYSCDNKKAFKKACLKILVLAKKGCNFCLHIVAHGNQDGILISTSNESISWIELEKILNETNSAMNKQLLLNMTSCKGLYGIKIADKLNSKPFFGLIGYADDLYVCLGKLINEMFYSGIANGTPIEKNIAEIQDKLDIKSKLSCISTQGYNIVKNVINNQ